MRKNLLVGLVLTVAAVVVVFVSAAFDLELEPVALLGVALGAVIALVPDGSPLTRLAGFAGGLGAAWIGYVVRAAMLPDSTGGRAVAVALIIVLAVAVAAVAVGRIPLWSTLLGAGGLAGAYELTYVDAPPEVASTSVTTATMLLLTLAVGFLATALVAPAGEQRVSPNRRAPKRVDEGAPSRLDDMMMEKTK
jgi:hypothetical protein